MQVSPHELVHLRVLQIVFVHHVPELRQIGVDELHRLVVDGLVVERVARAVRAVVVMVRAVVVVVDVRHILVRQAGGLRHGKEPVSGDSFPIDVHALHLSGHTLSLLRLSLIHI